MNKNRKGFEEFVTQNIDSAYRFAYSYVRNQQDAEDIVSQSIVKALSSLNTLKNPQFIKTWFFRIIINTSLSFLRRKSKSFLVTESDIDKLEAADDTYENIDLKKAVENLPVKYKTIIVLRFFEEFSIGEIAYALGDNINTVKTRLYKALEILKLDMKEVDL